MRDFKGMKRQRGRSRGGGGGKPQQQNANRAFDSNGPDGVKVRGNAQTVFEKYQQLARDATTSGDRVLAENYLQHAEHYFRLLRALQPQRPASEILGRDQFASGYDIDFEDEGAQGQQDGADEGASADAEGDDGQWRNRDERPRDERPRDDRPRDDRPRDDRPRDDRPRDDRRFEGRDRDFRDNRDRDNRDGRRDRWRDRDDRPRDDRPRVQPHQGAQGQGAQDRPDRPERNERPDDRPRDRDRESDRSERREDRPVRERDRERDREPVAAAPAEERPTQVLRDADGGESHAPAFLQAPAAPRPETGEDDGAAPARRPRRRRAPRSFEGGEGADDGEAA
jgi:hypothetical protein